MFWQVAGICLARWMSESRYGRGGCFGRWLVSVSRGEEREGIILAGCRHLSCVEKSGMMWLL